MFNMSVIDFICKYDSDDMVKNALNHKFMQYIKDDLQIDDVIHEMAISITDVFESMVTYEEIQGVSLHQGYASNVKSSIVKEVEAILKTKLLGG